MGVNLIRAEANDHAINRGNTLYSLFSGFMSGLREVNTKRLGEHLTWFLWQRTYRSQQPDVAARQANATACNSTVRDWAHVTPACMDYWQDA